MPYSARQRSVLACGVKQHRFPSMTYDLVQKVSNCPALPTACRPQDRAVAPEHLSRRESHLRGRVTRNVSQHNGLAGTLPAPVLHGMPYQIRMRREHVLPNARMHRDAPQRLVIEVSTHRGASLVCSQSVAVAAPRNMPTRSPSVNGARPTPAKRPQRAPRCSSRQARRHTPTAPNGPISA